MYGKTTKLVAMLFLYCTFITVDADGPWIMKMDAVEWDPGCSMGPLSQNPGKPSETKQQAIVRAWEGALELAASAKARFDKTQQYMDKHITTGAGMTYDDKEELFNNMDPM